MTRPHKYIWPLVAVVALLDAAAIVGAAEADGLPVSVAQRGFASEQVAAIRAKRDWEDIFKPIPNSRQWDWVFPDGDFFKSGMHGQGLYVSPAKDLVIAWFSTAGATDLPKYARAIAETYPSGN